MEKESNDFLKDIIFINELKVLYINGNKKNRIIYEDMFTTLFGSLTVADDIDDAMEKFEKNSFDLVISSVSIPNGKGLEILQHIRSMDQNVELIVLFEYGEKSDLLVTVNLNIFRYLEIPVLFDDIRELVPNLANKFKSRHYLGKKLAKLEKILDLYSESFIVTKTDTKGIITYASDAFVNLSGYSKKELLGNFHNIVRHPDMSEDDFKDMWETITSKKTWTGEVKNKNKQGTTYWAATTILPELDKEGDNSGYLSIRQDITYKKEN